MWHVVHTAPATELQVCRYLAAQQLVTYAPEFLPPRGTRPGSVRDRRHRWIFPGYVFFQAPGGFSEWQAIRWAPGVRSLLQLDGDPGVVDEAVIEHLRLRLAEARPEHPGRAFRPGQRVIVQSGPLAMVDALFDSCLRAADRVRVLVHLLGRQVAVEVDPALLRAAG